MTSVTKGALKAAKAAIDAHNYQEAERQARSVLEADSKHYTATVFLGLSLEKQRKLDEAEKVYLFAKENKPKELLALQGLLSVYEQQAARKVDEYGDIAKELAELYAAVDDQYKCQVIVDKYLDFAKQHGTKSQYKNALEFILPSSPIYDFLEGRLRRPADTYSRVIEIVETEESQRINKLIGERRTRLGAKIGHVTNEVKLEVYTKSNLEQLYQDVIAWSNDDDIRHMYEERLLQRAYDTLAVLPYDEKPVKRMQIQQLAEGMVIIKRPFALAWNITLEWKDYEYIQDFDVTLLRSYIELFPEDGLTKVLSSFLESDYSPFPKLPKEDKKVNGHVEAEELEEADMQLSPEDRLIVMSEGLEQSARSITSQRIMTEFYLALEEYSSVVVCAQKMIELLGLEQELSGLPLQSSIDAANVALGTALVQHESPRNHPRARQLFEAIIERKPANTEALIGLGLILEEEAEYEAAMEFFERVLQNSPDTRIKSEAAWCKASTGDYETGLDILQTCLQELQSSKDPQRDLLSLVEYRIGFCMWHLNTTKAARKDRNGAYSHFLAALKANVSYAPAYTSLGNYYADYGKDRGRARKCFQKAFELSVSEVEAAERLARLFAEQKDWELVEAVSQRVVESGKVRPPPGSKKKGISWPFAALGVCQLNSQDYAKSIVSFQAALRISPEDLHSWIGLGESYHGLGRYIAATKAFEHALNLQLTSKDDGSLWFPRYMLANVKRELGYYDEAINSYNAVLEARPDETGVTIALLQTYMENAWSCTSAGLFGRATDNCVEAINTAGTLVKLKSQAFNLWKTLGDVCSIFSWSEHYHDKFPVDQLVTLLETGIEENTYDSLSKVDQICGKNISKLVHEPHTKPSYFPIIASILCQKRAIHCSANDVHAQAVAWYNLGWTEYRASSTIAGSKEQANQYLKAAVQCFKRAIELESGNAEFWDALGIVTCTLNPKVSQHSFVRSLHLNDRSAKTWTNLGTLYLLQNDFQLANEAFTRGQSSDPEYAHAWLGQGILALVVGDLKEAHGLFTHAFEIADATSLIVKKLYSTSTFDQMLASKQFQSISDLLQPLFALHQLKSQKQGDSSYQHLAALVAERIGDHIEPIEVLRQVCEDIEAEYEQSESSALLPRSAQANADLARALLASGDLDSAIEHAEIALNLPVDEIGSEKDRQARTKHRLSAHLTSGLAHSLKGSSKAAISMFRESLDESSGDPDIVVLLSQVLWASGVEEEKDMARQQLFDCIENHPEHVGSISLLTVVAILDDDWETLDAVSADLQALRTRDGLSNQHKLRVERLLAAVGGFLGRDPANAQAQALGEATSTIVLEPSTTYGWSQLAGLTEDCDYPSQMALITAQGAVPPRGHLEAENLARAFAGTGLPADAQRGIMFAPWLTEAWEALA